MFVGCQRIDIQNHTTISTNDNTPRVKVEDGTLVFSSWEELEKTKEQLNLLSFDELERFCLKNKFTSPRYVFKKVVRAEQAELLRFEQKYAGIKNYEEALQLGISKPAHTADYLEAVGKGLIKVVEDNETESFYTFNLIDPTLNAVLDEEGFVVVEGELWQYTPTSMKYVVGSTEKKSLLRKSIETNEAEGVFVISPTEVRATTNWDLNGNNGNWVTPIEGNSNRRAKYERRGFCTINGSCQFEMFNKFFVNVFAQRQYLFVWAYADSYLPTFTFNGNWSYYFQRGCNGVDCLPDCMYSNLPLQVGVTPAPMVNRTYFGNNVIEAFPMHPHTSGKWINVPFTQPIIMNFSSWSAKIGATNLN